MSARDCLWTRRTSICGVASAIGVSVTLALLSACASAPPQQGPCTGSRTLVVHNNTRTDVDVIAFEGRSEKMLGIASPGRREFSLNDVPQQARFAAKSNGNFVAYGGLNGSAARRVEFRVECR